MRVLFIHPSFPGPFRHLAARLGSLPETKVLFISERSRREIKIPGVRRLMVSGVSNIVAHDRAEREIAQALRRGGNVANALLQLKHKGFTPDILCTSAGSGCGFYAADIFPEAFRVVYADWYYTKGDNYTFFNEGKACSPAAFAPNRVRNLCQCNALLEADLAITSTQWQKSQYPALLAQSIQVVHEGIDASYFSPQPGARFVVEGCDVAHVSELVTFSGRSLEPFRGFPQFCRSLPRLLSLRPQCHVLVMAAASHASDAEEDVPAALATLPPEQASRVHFLGFRSYEEYRCLLRASAVHVYLTAPFALSAGLFEAMSCGCLLVGSDTAPVREVIRHGENGFLCDFWDTGQLASTIAELLERRALMQPIRDAARNTILHAYNVETQSEHCLRLLLEHFRAF